MNALYSIGYSLTAKGFAFILNYIAINLLLLDSYGQFSLIFSTINSFIVVTSLGLLYCGNIISSKWMAKNREYVFNYFKFSFLLIVFLSFLFSGVYSLFSGNFLTIFLSTFLYSLVFLFDGFLYGIGYIKKLFIFGLINFVFSLMCSYFLMSNFGLKGALYALVFSKILLTILQSILFLKKFNNYSYGFKLKYTKQIFLFYKKNNIPIILSSLIATPIVTLLMYILSYNNGLKGVAVFSWCYQIYLLGMFVPMALGSYYITILNRKINEDKKIILLKITVFNIISSLFLCIVFFVFKNPILSFGNIYEISEAHKVFDAFMLCMIAYSINLGFFSYWSSIGKSYLHLRMQIIWSFIVFLLTLILVNKWGALSIPISMSIAFIVQFLAQIVELNKVK